MTLVTIQCRMARTGLASEAGEDEHDSESSVQYQLLNQFLNP